MLTPEFIEEMFAAGQDHYELCGLLWWRLPESQEHHFRGDRIEPQTSQQQAMVQKLRPLIGKVYTSRRLLYEALAKHLQDRQAVKTLREVWGKQWRTQLFETSYGDIKGYYAEGYLGQYLVILPAYNMVAVRQVKNHADFNHKTDTFDTFPKAVLDCAQIMSKARSN